MRRIKTLISILAMLLNEKGEALMSGGSDGGGEPGGGEGGSDGGEGGGPGGKGDNDGVSFNAGGDDGGEPGGDDGIKYPEGLEDTLKGDKTLLRHYNQEKGEWDVPGIMKSLVNTKKMVGSDKIQKPGKNWTQEQFHDFFKEIGLPETVSDYKIENKGLPEGAKPDENLFEGFKEKAFEAGILPHQAETLLEWFNDTSSRSQEQIYEQQKREWEEGKRALEQEYGKSLQGKLEMGMSALKQFSTESEIEKFKNKGMLDDPDFARFLVKISENMNDDNFQQDLINDFHKSPDDAERELQELFKQGTKGMTGQQKKAWSQKVAELSAIKKRSRHSKGRQATM